jgi:hypothetical protein
MTTYRLMDGLSGRPGNGPASANAYSGNYLGGIGFEVTASNKWLAGYWWWVCNTGQQTGAQKFALWQIVNSTTGILIPGSVVTSGALTAGQWNYVPLPAPVPLSIGAGLGAGAAYMAVTGYVSTTGIPYTANQFTTGDPYVNGITNGPLFAWGIPNALSVPQGADSTVLGSDPAAAMPDNDASSANFWVDVQITDQAPAGTSYRLWPSQPNPANWANDGPPQSNWTLGTEFNLSQACALDNIWFYSQAGATQLPTDCSIYSVPAQAKVAGTNNSSPSWSGAAGSGWVSCPYTGVVLPAGDYKVAVYNGGSVASPWSATSFPYWSGTAPGANGITAGPLSAPNTATATAPGQSTYQVGDAYPLTYAAAANGATYWVDVEVTPVASGGLLVASFP